MCLQDWGPSDGPVDVEEIGEVARARAMGDALGRSSDMEMSSAED
jgi:mRNA-degrading endonuclease toxin of MazEF toxin-antitoxin module